MPIDPFEPLVGGFLHKADIAVAELVTGVPGRTISRHAIAPAVRRGVPVQTALAQFHWGCIAVVGLAGIVWAVRKK